MLGPLRGAGGSALYSQASSALIADLEPHLQTARSPFLALSAAVVRQTVAEMRALLPGVVLRYAVKANRDIRLLELLQREGLGFALWEWADLKAVAALAPDPRQVHLTYPRPTKTMMLACRKLSIPRYTVDYITWVERLGQLIPYCEVMIRARVVHPSTGLKFQYPQGAPVERLAHIWNWIGDIELFPRGLSFHLGSHLQDPTAWERVFTTLARVQDRLPSKMDINLGGGLPVAYGPGDPDWRDAARSIAAIITAWETGRGSGHTYWLEPGRALVAEAGLLVVRVKEIGRHRGRRLAVLNGGSPHGLMELREGILHPMYGPHPAEAMVPTLLAGPAGPGGDPLATVALPRALAAGDWLVLGKAGAYTASLAERPKIRWVEWGG
ncbi:MAG TPA: hypothetical protein VEI97_11635 [bacterium]|nr:hypothetical protein [bacterium]